MDNFQEIGRVLIRILVLNWLVAFIKIGLGLATGAISILADGAHAFFDGVSNILGLIGIKIAQRPPNQKYPYGYSKYEAIATFGIFGFLIFTVLKFSESIYQRIISPFQPEINFLILGILASTLIIDYLVAKYEFSKGKELKSIILRADSLHTRSHLFITSSVILGMVAVKLGYPILDPIIAAVVVIWIIKLAISVFKETSNVLSDKAQIKPKEIEKIVKSLKGVVSSHQIRTRGSEREIFLDMHLVLAPDTPLTKAHQICRQAREKIQEKFPDIKDITIHPEPVDKYKKCSCE
jgi:cation diffusion facilitator family transporter